MTDVTRFEVIDHTKYGEGRVFVAWPCRIELSYQDDDRTLKVFIKDVPIGPTGLKGDPS